MVKKLISVILTVFLLFAVLLPSVAAYEPTGIDIGARNAMLISLDTGQILYSKGEIGRDAAKVNAAKVYPASVTKIMTVTLMLESEKFNPDKKIAMTKEVLDLISGTGSSVSYLRENEEVTELELAYMILMSSFGDCAYLAAIHYGGSVQNFVDMMNDKAKELGLMGTHYSTPVGLHDEQNYTTVWDTYLLASYALKNETFKTICHTARYTIGATNMSRSRVISTTNFLQDSSTNYYYPYAHGVKTGFTDEAGRCLVTTASYDGYNYMCILFGCPVDNRRRHEFVYAKDLFKWAFTTFEFKNVADTENPIDEIKINYASDRDALPIYVGKNFITLMPSDADDSTVTVEKKFLSESFDAPIKKGTVVGTATFKYAGETIGSVNLVAGDDVERSIFFYAAQKVKEFFASSYMKILYVILALAVIIFIISVIRLNLGRAKKRKVKYMPYNGEKKGKDHYDHH